MSSPISLTADQSRCLRLDRNIAVTAGAGSGKTRVLVERYLEILKRHPELTPRNIVAITFTRKAAAEMKDRIRKNIETIIADSHSRPDQVERWIHIRDALTDAPISTIHSFAAELLYEFALAAGVDPHFAVADESDEAEMLERAAIRALTDAERDLPAQLKTALRYFYRPQLIELLGTWAAEPERIQKTESMIECPSSAEKNWKAVERELTGRLDIPHYLSRLGQLKRLNNTVEAHRTNLLNGFQSLTDPDYLCRFNGLELIFEALFDQSSKPRKTTRWNEMQEIGQELQRFFQPLIHLRGLYHPEIEERARIAIADLLPLVKRTAEHLCRLRRDTATLSFNDLERFTVSLLTVSPDRDYIRHRLQDRFRYFMIDEFQDTNIVQWQIIRPLVSDDDGNLLPDRLFIVGDPKQSIYGFRGADVTVFNRVRQEILAQQTPSGGKMHGATPEAAGNAAGDVRLADNFRSLPEILDSIDALCETFMTGGPEYDIAYEPLHAARPGPQNPPGTVGVLMPEECLEEPDTTGRWARLLGRHIQRLVATTSVRYRDIAVMFPRRTRLDTLKAGLQETGVPFVIYKGIGFWQQLEIQDMIAVIRWLADSGDRAALMSCLRSPLCGLSDVALLYLHQFQPGFPWVMAESGEWPECNLSEWDQEAIDRARQWLREANALAGKIPISVLMEHIVDITGAWGSYDASGNGPRIIANIEKFLDILTARDGEGIAPLRETAQQLIRKGSDALREGEEIPENAEDDMVRLMTVHAAKGLEFPVVYLTELESYRKPARGCLLFDDDLGVGIRLPERFPGDTKTETVAYALIGKKWDEKEWAEKKRLFYVAATRAMDRLYFVHRPGKDGSLATPREPPRSWLDWLGGMLRLTPDDIQAGSKTCQTPAGKPLRVEIVTSVPESAPVPGPDVGGDVYRSVLHLPEAVLPPAVGPAPGPPATQTTFAVTELELFHRDPERYYRELVLYLPEHFRSIQGKSAVDTARAIGTTFHELLETPEMVSGEDASAYIRSSAGFYGFEAGDADAFVERLERMVEKIRAWPRLHPIQTCPGHAELPFTLPFPGGSVEGVFDRIWLESGVWHIVDFKTDLCEPGRNIDEWISEHTDIHRFQMEVYALALKKYLAPHQPVIPVILYFASIGREVLLTFDAEALQNVDARIAGDIEKINRISAM